MTSKSMSSKKVTPGEKSVATRRRIVAAGRRVFVRYPYHQASIRMIAAEGGVHFSLINHYFNKADLFGAVVAEVSQELWDAYVLWLKDLEGLSSEEGLALFLDRVLDYLFDKPDLLLILLKNAGGAGTAEGAPAFDYFSRYVFSAGATMARGLPATVDAEGLMMWSYALLNLLINYVGAASYHCQVLNMEPGGEPYRQWVKKCLMVLFLPALKELLAVA